MAGTQFALVHDRDELIPPVPTREQELAYLDKLEVELRMQNIQNTPPDPSREAREAMRIEFGVIQRDYYRKFALGFVLFTPLSIWLTRRSRYREAGGFPQRVSPNYHVFRFWGYFGFFNFVFAGIFGIMTVDRSPFAKHEYYLYETRKRHL